LLSSDKIASLNSITFPKDAKVGYPPENVFMPKDLSPLNLKKFPGSLYQTPTQILNENNTQVFYRQDDRFKQPMVSIRCKMMTKDLNYPKT